MIIKQFIGHIVSARRYIQNKDLHDPVTPLNITNLFYEMRANTERDDLLFGMNIRFRVGLKNLPHSFQWLNKRATFPIGCLFWKTERYESSLSRMLSSVIPKVNDSTFT